MVAAMTQEEAFLIGPDRAGMIGSALADVSQYYNISANGPAMSLFKLGAALAIVNVPILIAVGGKRRAARVAKATAQPPAPDVAAMMGDGATPPRKYDLNG